MNRLKNYLTPRAKLFVCLRLLSGRNIFVSGSEKRREEKVEEKEKQQKNICKAQYVNCIKCDQ